MFILKGCPKCKGDLAAETNLRRLTDDADIACLQCGYYLRPDEQHRLFARLVPVTRRPQRASSFHYAASRSA
jgi:hypothetical protein